MRQNATQRAHGAQKRHTWRTPFRALIGSWVFTPSVLAVILSVVFSIFGYRMQQRESEELHQVFDQHLMLVTRVLEVASEHALRDGHQRDLHKIIQSVESHDDDLKMLIADAQGDTLFASHAKLSASAHVDALIEETLEHRGSVAEDVGSGLGRRRLVTALLDDETMPDAVLVIEQSMRELEEDLKATRVHAIQVTVVMALFCFIFGLLFAQLRVRDPLRTLRTMMDGFEDVEGSVVAASARGLQSYRIDNEVRAVTDAFGELIGRLTRARHAVDVLHAQRETLVHRLVESTGREKLLQFAYELAHEIGSPLQVILGRAAMLDARAEQPDEVRRHAKIVMDETQRIQRIVQQSLQETADSQSALSDIDLVERVERIAEVTHERLDGRPVSFHFDTPDHPVIVKMDSDAIDQILRNLLANAHHACAEAGEVFIRVRAQTHGAELTIEDTGTGMSEETLKQALQPFFSTRPHAAGHGLGLPIVQRLCRDYGVDFDIRSREGDGTTVVLTFDDERSTLLNA